MLRRRVYGADDPTLAPVPGHAIPGADGRPAGRPPLRRHRMKQRPTGRRRVPAHRDRRLRTGRTLHHRGHPRLATLATGTGRETSADPGARGACPARRWHRLQQRAHRRARIGSHVPAARRRALPTQLPGRTLRRGPPTRGVFSRGSGWSLYPRWAPYGGWLPFRRWPVAGARPRRWAKCVRTCPPRRPRPRAGAGCPGASMPRKREQRMRPASLF